MRPAPVLLLCPLLLGAAASCEAGDARAAWLRHTLVLDNQADLERAPELVAGKFAKMSEAPFAYLRGSAAQFARDVFEPGGAANEPLRHTDAAVAHVALIGDAHLENLGTFLRRDGTLVLDFDDFDAATYGPFEYDLRRLAVSAWLACEQARAGLPTDASDGIDCVTVAASAAVGYRAEILAQLDHGTAPSHVDDTEPRGAIVDELFADARRDGESARNLEQARDAAAGGRLREGELEPARIVRVGRHSTLVYGDSLHPLDPGTRAAVSAWVAQAHATLVDPRAPALHELELIDAAQRLGIGVSSYPVRRYAVLVRGATDALDDDVLLELKELRDAVVLPGARRIVDAPFAGNGPRVVGLARALQTDGNDDAWLGWASDGALALRLRDDRGWQRGFEVATLSARWRDGRWRVGDLQQFVTTAGVLLARAHAGAPAADGRMPLPALRRALGGDAGVVADIGEFVRTYGPVVLEDHQRLHDLIEADGFDLGYGRW